MKLILSALLICGAFLFSPSVKSQDNALLCLDGGEWKEELQGCAIPKPDFFCELASVSNWPKIHPFDSGPRNVPLPVDQINTSCPANTAYTEYKDCANNVEYQYTLPAPCSTAPFEVSMIRTVKMSQRYIGGTEPAPWQVQDDTYTNTKTNIATWIQTSEGVCEQPFVISDNIGDQTWCYYIPADEPEEPEECGTTPLNPCPPPPCVPGGGGLMVCKDDPDAKCWLDELANVKCEEGCGWINDEFFCTVQGNDNPSFEKCKFTFNGYACPSELKDDITEPEKPVDQMTKQDVKDTNIGIESRQDVTNELLQTQLAAWERESDETQKGLADLNSNLGGKLNTANGHLSDISGTLTEIGDFLKPAGEIEPPPPEPESYYESEYEDGIMGIWEERSAALMQTPIFDFMNQFKLTPSGTQPEMSLCFNFIVNLGCSSLEIPSGLWAFLRIVILITAAYTCRRIVVGE